jgi:predicted  nucleic acid-binding Zn-ribbon protein
LNKISQIKSPNSADGAKLSNLLDQSLSIDEEIEQLNRRIESLKAKKKTIATEIQSTSSVLESRSARYVEMFKNLDKQGLEAMKSYMNMETSSVAQSILTLKPVDVSFVKNYTPIHSRILEPKLGEEDIIAKHINKPPVVKTESHDTQQNKPVSTLNNGEKSVMGMKPYVIPEDETPISNPIEDSKDLNYDHGPSPYEQGYVKGEQLGNSIRNKVQGLFKTVIQAIPERPQNETQPLPIVKFEDASNTVSQKLDYDPIRLTLLSRIEALTDMVQNVSKRATVYHKYSIVWQDVIKVLKKQETKLQHQISESTTSWNDSNEGFMETLRGTVEQLKTVFELHKFKLEKSDPDVALISQVISNEIKAICDTLAMVSKNDQYKSIFEEFKSFGLDGYITK